MQGVEGKVAGESYRERLPTQANIFSALSALDPTTMDTTSAGKDKERRSQPLEKGWNLLGERDIRCQGWSRREITTRSLHAR